MTPNEKGGKEERKQARQISLWMFGDEDVLWRHPKNSGAIKTVYAGDLAPVKNIKDFGWNKFGIIFEVKSGYPKQIPNFWSYDKVTEWFIKCRIDGQKTNQNIILMLCQFKNRSALLITDQYFNGKIQFNICFPVNINGNIEYGYVYLLKDVLKYNFKELFENIDYC